MNALVESRPVEEEKLSIISLISLVHHHNTDHKRTKYHDHEDEWRDHHEPLHSKRKRTRLFIT
jgi:hypothetical protein